MLYRLCKQMERIDLMSVKEKIINELKMVERDGIDDYINMKKKTDFFVAPASTRFHLNYKGGLAEHCWNVFTNFVHLREYHGLDNPKHENFIPMDSVRLSALGHDDCKINLYNESTTGATKNQLWRLNKDIGKNITRVLDTGVLKEGLVLDGNGQVVDTSFDRASELIAWLENPNEEPPIYTTKWEKNETFPAGHGEKSIFIIQRYIKLKKREILAIRYHMGAFEDGIFGGFKMSDFNVAQSMYPDVKLLHIADNLAAFKEDWVE